MSTPTFPCAWQVHVLWRQHMFAHIPRGSAQMRRGEARCQYLISGGGQTPWATWLGACMLLMRVITSVRAGGAPYKCLYPEFPPKQTASAQEHRHLFTSAVRVRGRCSLTSASEADDLGVWLSLSRFKRVSPRHLYIETGRRNLSVKLNANV